jgi:hypothetical protein
MPVLCCSVILYQRPKAIGSTISINLSSRFRNKSVTVEIEKVLFKGNMVHFTSFWQYSGQNAMRLFEIQQLGSSS